MATMPREINSTQMLGLLWRGRHQSFQLRAGHKASFKSLSVYSLILDALEEGPLTVAEPRPPPPLSS